MVVLVLGWGRLSVHSFLDFHEIVDEYGVHWNFYTTISVIEFLFSVFAPYSPFTQFVLMAYIGFQEYGHQVLGWKEWMLSEERDMASMFDMNREGVMSVPMYTFIMLCGPYFMKLGYYFFD